MKHLTGYCGLYCGDCIRYKCRASDLALELLNEIEKHHFTEYAKVKRTHVKEFGNFESFVALLKAVSEIRCETPCGSGGDGCAGSCGIIRCVRSKKINGCWEIGSASYLHMTPDLNSAALLYKSAVYPLSGDM